MRPLTLAGLTRRLRVWGLFFSEAMSETLTVCLTALASVYVVGDAWLAVVGSYGFAGLFLAVSVIITLNLLYMLTRPTANR